MTSAEASAASMARLTAMNDTQMTLCDEDCQAAQAMGNLIVILVIVAISMFFCLLNVWLVWKGHMPFCCCCSCSMGGLFPLKSRQPDEIARKKGKKAHTKKDQEEDEEDPDPEANLPCTRDCSSISLPRISLLARRSEITG